MGFKLSILLLFGVFLSGSNVRCVDLEVVEWSWEKFMDTKEEFLLRTHISMPSQMATFRIEIRNSSELTETWLAIGLAPAGELKNADVVFAWSDGSEIGGKLTDCYIDSNGTVTEDQPQLTDDWSLKSFNRTVSTVAEISRSFVINGPSDSNITNEVTHLLYAFGTIERSEEGDVRLPNLTSVNSGFFAVNLLRKPTFSGATFRSLSTELLFIAGCFTLSKIFYN